MKTENKDLINKGIMLGVHFSTVLFNDYFKADFQRKLNVEAPLKGVLLMVVADLLVGCNQERGLELFDWATGTHLELVDELDPELIEKCIRAIERNKIISN
jgi:hypothetical protein